MGAIPGALADTIRPEALTEAISPGAVANAVRGSVLLVAGVMTDSEDAISLGRQIASGGGLEASSSSSTNSGLRQPSPQEVAEMHEELGRWRRELDRARAESGSPGSGPDGAARLAEELARREAELRDIEDRHRLLEEEVRNYPRPGYLEGDEGGVNVAVVGNSGVGKSLLINSLRGVQSGDEGWAPVGVNQTTTEPVAYAVPGQPRARLWDLAGATSQQFSRGGYTRAIGLRHFDLVLVVTTCRFTQTEAVLLSELAGSGVPSFVVRTMIDVDIASNEADHGQGGEETKRGILEDLRERGVPAPYLVNSRSPGDHDFPRLAADVHRAAAAGEGGGSRSRRSEAATAAAFQDPSSRRPQTSQRVVQFEAGEAAEVWSKQFKVWAKCVVERPCQRADEYDIAVPGASDNWVKIPRVPALALRKAQSFKAGEEAEIIVLQGPQAGSWARCCIAGEGDKPDTYKVRFPGSPDSKVLHGIPSMALRKVTKAQPEAQQPLLDLDSLRAVLKALREICNSKEFQATIDTLQEMGTHKEEVRKMKRTFVSHQFGHVLQRYNVAVTGLGWKDFLTFTGTQGHDPEVVKLAHEVERMMRVRVGDFFGIQPGQGEQAEAPKPWAQQLKDTAAGLISQAANRSREAAQAQAASGAPTSRLQRATAGHVDPMSRSMVAAARWTR